MLVQCEGDCRYEPQAALSPGDHALSAIEQIATASRTRLEHGGLLAVEHGCDQGNEVRHWLERLGYTAVRTLRDLEGRDRVSQGTWRAG